MDATRWSHGGAPVVDQIELLPIGKVGRGGGFHFAPPVLNPSLTLGALRVQKSPPAIFVNPQVRFHLRPSIS